MSLSLEETNSEVKLTWNVNFLIPCNCGFSIEWTPYYHMHANVRAKGSELNAKESWAMRWRVNDDSCLSETRRSTSHVGNIAIAPAAERCVSVTDRSPVSG